MITYSRNFLLTRCMWWKSASELQTSRHYATTLSSRLLPTKPLNSTTWRTLQSLGILRRFRGSRGGRFLSKNTPKTDFYEQNLNLITIQNLNCSGSTTSIKTKSQFISTIQTKQDQRRLDVTAYEHKQQQQRGVSFGNLIQIPLVKLQPINKPSFTVALINSRSLNKNGLKVKEHVVDHDCDIAAVTETWLPDNDVMANQIIGDTCPQGYRMFHAPRKTSQRGGGVGLMYKSSLDLRCVPKDVNSSNFLSFEYCEYLLKSTIWVRFVVVYRPPPSSANGLTITQFFREFSTFLECLVLQPTEIIILGDFNFHVDCTSDRDADDFLNLLDSCNLSQHVVGSTHRSGHTLDLLITRQTSSIVQKINIFPPWISDHSLVQATIQLEKASPITSKVTFRKWKNIDKDAFLQDLIDAVENLRSVNSVDDIARHYNSSLENIADAHAPIKSKVITTRPLAEWYTPELQIEKKKRRKCERRYRRTGTPEDARLFIEQSNYYCNLLVSTRQNFYQEKIESCANDQKAMSAILNKLLHRVPETQLPVHNDASTLINSFAAFFTEKIATIRENLQQQPSFISFFNHESCPFKMTSFSAVSEGDIEKMIRKANDKSCNLDPIPTKILKHHLLTLLPVITRIINLSLSEAVMPSIFKQAVLTPILKKPSLDKDNLQNYRPISNLAFISKIIEKVVDHQITEHIENNNLNEVMQSAYRQHHSTETAWVRLHNDILTAIDNNMAVLLVCLDLSAAFDTVDHTLLLQCLEHRLGITGNCLEWLSSYLRNRTFRVLVNGEMSNDYNLKFGVPQGSVLGPKLFTLYMLPLSDISRHHNVNLHIYADDCQLYISFKKDNTITSASKMECLANDIRNWMTANLLKLNGDKTDIMVLNGPRRSEILLPPITIGDESVSKSDSTTLLGVDVDSTLSMKNHVKKITKCCFYKLYNLRKIRRFISEDAAKTIVHSLITSKLDYCNSILNGLPNTTLESLVRVQKAAARLISNKTKFEHISPVLKDLHWLPIKKRIEYKILVLTFKCMHNLAPTYLTELLHRRSNKGTRADDKNLLVVPKVKKSTFGGRSFSFTAPYLWNQLPDHLRHDSNLETFKKHLKTYLF